MQRLIMVLGTGLLLAACSDNGGGDEDKSNLLCERHSDCGSGWLCNAGRSRCERGLTGGVSGVSPTRLVVGMTAALENGPTDLGRGMKAGIEAYFNFVNTQLGGVHGRKLELLALDDKYEPGPALDNVKKFVADKSVFAVMGSVGTPTAAVTVPYAVENALIFFGAYTGAALLRKDPPDRYVFNFRASYVQETAATVRYFTVLREPGIPVDNLAVLPQGEDSAGTMDSYGQSGFDGVAKALKEKAQIEKSAIAYATYKRNTEDVEPAVKLMLKWLGSGKRVKSSDAKIHAAIVMVPTSGPAAAFVKAMLKEVSDIRGGRSQGGAYGLSSEELAEIRKVEDLAFSSVSFVGSNALADKLKAFGEYDDGETKRSYCEKVIISQVVPPPDSNSSGVLQYKEQLKAYDGNLQPGFVSLEGYLVARLFVQALQNQGPDLTTESFISTLEGLKDVNLSIGTTLTFDQNDHQASDKIWGTALTRSCTFNALDAF